MKGFSDFRIPGHASVSSAVSASDETQPWNVMDTPILDGSSPPPVEGPIQDKIDPAGECFTESNEEARDH